MTAASGGVERPRPIVLVVLDGFGIGHDPSIDAIAQARMPNWKAFMARWPHSALEASEEFVGLPAGQMGNSEVGHLKSRHRPARAAGSARIDQGDLVGRLLCPTVVLAVCARAKEADHTLHLISLVGPAASTPTTATSSPWPSLPAARVSSECASTDSWTAATPHRVRPSSSCPTGEATRAVHPDAKFATIGGRYYAMDRDKRWERTRKGYDAIVHGVADFHRALRRGGRGAGLRRARTTSS